MKILKHPLIVLFFILFGILCGLFFEQEYIDIIGKFGDLYIQLIQSTVIPILVSAIISSVAKLVQERTVKNLLKRIFIVFIISMFIILMITMTVSFVIEPGVLSLSQQISINKIIKNTNTDIDLKTKIYNPVIEVEENPFFLFIAELISSNIFKSLVEGSILEIVFFSFLLGITLGKITNSKSNFILGFVSEIFQSLQVLISWIIYFLPFGLFAIVMKQVASIGIDTFTAVIKFLLTFLLITFIIAVINCIVIWRRSGLPFKQVFFSLVDIIILPLTTRNSFACIPVAIEVLSEKLYFDRATSNLLVPLSFTISRVGNVVYFCVTAIFISQVYGVDLSIAELLLLPVVSIIAGIATAGASGFVALQALSIVTIPLGLPFEAIFVILYLIDPIADPFRTLLIVYTDVTLITLVSNVYDKRKTQEQSIDEQEEELDVTKAVMMHIKN